MNEDVERVLSSGRRSNRSVLGEQSRVYRSVINGKLDPVEGTRLVFMLKEIRCTLEAVATAAAAAPPPPKGDVNIIIRPIERGSMFNANGQLVTSEEAAAERALPPLLELAAQPEPEPVPVAQYEPRHLLSSTEVQQPRRCSAQPSGGPRSTTRSIATGEPRRRADFACETFERQQRHKVCAFVHFERATASPTTRAKVQHAALLKERTPVSDRTLPRAHHPRGPGP